MKRVLAIALVVASIATAWAQDSGSAGSADAVGSAGSADTVGSADSAGSAGSDAVASGSAGSGSAVGTAGSGSAASKAPAPIVVVIPPDVSVPEVSAAASPSVVRLGDKFVLFITATYASDVEVNLREPIELGGDIEVVRKTSANKKAADGRNVREWQLELVVWDVGKFSVPPLAVTFTSQGKAGQLATNAVPIEVVGVLGDMVDDPKLVRGDAPPVTLMSRDWFWAWIGGGAAVLVGALGALLWLRKRKKSRVRRLIGTLVVSTPQPRRLDMTSERALARLLEIEQSGILDRDDDRKLGYAEMVDVIREYTGARYRVITLDQTTAELMRSLKKVAPADECAQIAAWLERCDIVKYGGLAANSADARGVLDGARTLVMTTTKAPGSDSQVRVHKPEAA